MADVRRTGTDKGALLGKTGQANDNNQVSNGRKPLNRCNYSKYKMGNEKNKEKTQQLGGGVRISSACLPSRPSH